MLENRSLKLDLIALVLMSTTAVLTVSLATYDATDPPSTLVYPPHTECRNACGPIGAYVSHVTFQSLGVGAFYLAGSLGLLTAVMVWRRAIDQPVVRAVGWTASLAAVTTLATMMLPSYTPGPEVGAGGYLGAMGQAVLESNFATAGAYILALSLLLAGLLLCTDYLLLRVAAATTMVSGRSLMTLGHLGHTSTARQSSRPRTDLQGDDTEDEYEEDEDEDYEYEEDDQEEDEWEEDEWEEEDPEEEAAPLKVRIPASKQPEEVAPNSGEDAETQAEQEQPLKTKLASALRITKKKAKQSEREEVIDQLEAADHLPSVEVQYEPPPLDLLLDPDDISYEEHKREVRRKAKLLEKTFLSFGFSVRVVEIETGPVIAQYEVELEAGLRLAKITNLADDLAIALRVSSVRIVAPIPGKNTVGIEIPNKNRQLVRLREVIEESKDRTKRMKIPIYLGKDVSGNPLVVDLTTLPHLLIAGRTGTGKSVCLNSIIVSMLMNRGPDEIRMLMVDPKMVELSGYSKLPHLMHPVVTDMRKAEAILAWAVDKMEERYQLLARAGVRHVSVFNQLSEEELRDRIEPTSEAEWETIPKQLPFVVIVADEIADLMMTAGKDVEQHIIRLAQKSRAVGIHLILATQKPTVDVITGLIKSNLPARISFQVASRTDSRVVLDEMGADRLLGNGDLLFLSPGTSQLLRGQGTYLSDDEISRVVDFVGTETPQFAKELIELKTRDEEDIAAPGALNNRDDLYEAAVDVVVRERRGSVSLLQRCLGIGYGRAARLIDFMAEDGIVGEYNGSQAREVLISFEEWEAICGDQQELASDKPPTAPSVSAKLFPTNKILPGSDESSELEEENEAWEEDEAEADEGEEGEGEEEDQWEEEGDEADEECLEDDEEWEEEDAAEEDQAEEDEDEDEEYEEDADEEAEYEEDKGEEDEYEEEEDEEGDGEEDEYEDEEEEDAEEDEDEWEEDEQEYADSA